MDATRLNFTKAALMTLPIPAVDRTIYHDSKTAGLQLRVTPSGTKTFSVFRRVKGGEPVRVSIGRFPDVSIEQARRQAAVLNAEAATGIDPTKQARERRQELTFAALFALYLAQHSKLRKRTWKEDLSKYEQYLETPLGKKQLSQIRRSDITAIHARITADGHGVTANRVHALISSVFGWALTADLWAENPAIGVRKNPETARDRFVRGDELPGFFRALGAEPGETIRDFFLMSLLTGARRANVMEMAWKDINLPIGEWRIGRTKNGDPQIVHLAEEAMKILKRRNEDRTTPFVFPGNGVTGHLVEPKKGWWRIKCRMAGLELLGHIAAKLRWSSADIEREEGDLLNNADPDSYLTGLRVRAASAGLQSDIAPLPDLRLHDLRRTMASWQLRTGASLSIIGKSLNHKSAATTAIYARLDTDPVKESVSRAADEMFRVGRVSGDHGKTALPESA